MTMYQFFRTLLLGLLACSVGIHSASALEPLQKGDNITVIQATPLYFNSVAFRTAKMRERFTVILHRTDTHKVYVSAKDAEGKEIALSVDESACIPIPKNATAQ